VCFNPFSLFPSCFVPRKDAMPPASGCYPIPFRAFPPDPVRSIPLIFHLFFAPPLRSFRPFFYPMLLLFRMFLGCSPVPKVRAVLFHGHRPRSPLFSNIRFLFQPPPPPRRLPPIFVWHVPPLAAPIFLILGIFFTTFFSRKTRNPTPFFPLPSF